MSKPLLALLLSLVLSPALAQVQGAGASFPSRVYSRWADAYEKSTGVRVDYRATGSGDGVKKISERAVQFGGSDTPLPAEELAKRQLVQLPMLVGGIVPVVHLPGLPAARLQLSGELLAALMAGEISHWNDSRIAALNPSLALPALRVKRVVRADKSGTTEGFTRYLALVSADFAQRVGASQKPVWPGEVLAVEGNDGVSAAMKANEGALGYVSHDRVLRDRLVGIQLRNADGQWVSASEPGFRSAIRHSALAGQGDDTASLLNRPGAESWPITMTSFVLIDAKPARADAATQTLRFLYWCFVHGDELTRGSGFAPLTVNVQSRLSARLASVKAKDGGALDYQRF